MKKKILAVILSAAMALSLAACGDKAVERETPASSVEEVKKEEPKTSVSEEVTSTEEKEEKEDTTSVEEKKEENASVDKAEYYKDFFKNYDMGNVEFCTDVEQSGITLTVKAAAIGKDSYSIMGYNGNEMVIYTIDGVSYTKMSQEGVDMWVKATLTSESSSALTSENLAIDADEAMNAVYEGTEVIDGVEYDVLAEEGESEDATYYVNAKTGELEKVKLTSTDDEGNKAETWMSLKKIEKIELPSDAEAATEVDEQTFAMYYLFATLALFPEDMFSGLGDDTEE